MFDISLFCSIVLMFSIKNYPYECTRKCCCLDHAKTITRALTKRAVSDEKLAAFIAKTCRNFCDIVDEQGRSPVHLAASVGRVAILEWLLKNGAVATSCEHDGGMTPLHCAIYYGFIDCAVLLVRYGVSLDILDNGLRYPLHYVCRKPGIPLEKSIENEVVVWGSNKNYNLGIDNIEGPNIAIPQCVDFFRKSQIYLKLVAIGSFHTVFVDKQNNIYSVGHGEGGRLGTGKENSLVTPKKLKCRSKNTPEVVTSVSVSSKHTLVLTDCKTVYACGLNDHCQLGIHGIGSQSNILKEIPTFRNYNEKELQHVIAKDYHSIAFSKNHVYFWGSNNGQFGIGSELENVITPQQMKLPLKSIELVEASNVATAVYVKSGNIYLLYGSKLRTLKSPEYEQVKVLALSGGNNPKSAKGSATALKLAVATQSAVHIWYEKTQTFYKCILQRNLPLRKLYLKGNNLWLLSSDGVVYEGKCQQVTVNDTDNKFNGHNANEESWQVSKPNKMHAIISSEQKILVDLKRVPMIDRAVDLFVNTDFTSFAVLQESHLKFFEIPSLGAEEYSFKKLYNDVCEEDNVHDMVFTVDGRRFPVHKFIVYSRAPGLYKLASTIHDHEMTLQIDGLTARHFDLILKNIYTNYFPNLEDIEKLQEIAHSEDCNLASVIENFIQLIVIFGLENLGNYLKEFLKQVQTSNIKPMGLPDKSHYRISRIYHTDLKELYDVQIVCSDGVSIGAHKCMLVSRMVYFELMFSNPWAEQDKIELQDVSSEYMLPILEFIYSANVEHFRKQNYSQSFLYKLIILCDQFFIERLRKVCEIALLQRISLRKSCEMLDFAFIYNSDTLKKGAMDYICQNLIRILTFRTLENCDPAALKQLNNHYRNMFSDDFDYRVITPDPDAVEDEILLSFVDDFEVDLSECVTIDESSKKSNAKHSADHIKKDTRQYEKNAIKLMMENISLNDDREKSSSNSIMSPETDTTAEELPNDSIWTRVKPKNLKKRSSGLSESDKSVIDNSNNTQDDSNIVMHIEKEKENLSENPVELSSPPKTYNLNLSSFTTSTPCVKMSQKERKRLLSERFTLPSITNGIGQILTTNETEIVQQPSVWNLSNNMPSTSKAGISLPAPATGSSADSTSFANITRKSKKNTNINSGNEAENNFASILAEELRDREYLERMRHRSLELNQIEEMAIASLREFYNIDNVDDEIITIERVSDPHKANFDTLKWHR